MTKRAARARRTIAGPGTPAEAWAAYCASVRPVEAVELIPAGGRLLVIAAHPQDEVLGSGGLIYGATQLGREVRVLCVTDGGASHPGSAKWRPETLGPARLAETERALAELGVKPDQISALGLTDGRLDRAQAEVSRAVVRQLQAEDVVVTPWRYDGVADHETVARAVVDALQVLPLTHLEAPIWGWHWAQPDKALMPVRRAVRLTLDPDVRQHKAAAIQCFRTQLEPDDTTGRDAPLPEWAVRRFVGHDEIYFR
jgi:LmbE family N-acetylglucosaminyl deacetylase